MGPRRPDHRPRHRGRAGPGPFQRRGRRRHPRRRGRQPVPGLPEAEPAARPSRVERQAPLAPRPGRHRGRLFPSPVFADGRGQGMGLPPVRPHGPGQHRPPARRGRRGPEAQGLEEGHRHDPGLQFALCFSRPEHGRENRRRRGLPKPGLRRGPADRRHELPELRESGEARDHVAVRAGHRRDGGRLPGVRDPRHGRQRRASTTRPRAYPSSRPRSWGSSASSTTSGRSSARASRPGGTSFCWSAKTGRSSAERNM